jgi:hypothetical protein
LIKLLSNDFFLEQPAGSGMGSAGRWWLEL